MRISIATLLLAAIVGLPDRQLKAAFVSPIGLAPGEKYQLVFATADTIAGTYGTEEPYNAFVTAEAALNPLLPAATWTAITSTVQRHRCQRQRPLARSAGVQHTGD